MLGERGEIFPTRRRPSVAAISDSILAIEPGRLSRRRGAAFEAYLNHYQVPQPLGNSHAALVSQSGGPCVKVPGLSGQRVKCSFLLRFQGTGTATTISGKGGGASKPLVFRITPFELAVAEHSFPSEVDHATSCPADLRKFRAAVAALRQLCGHRALSGKGYLPGPTALMMSFAVIFLMSWQTNRLFARG